MGTDNSFKYELPPPRPAVNRLTQSVMTGHLAHPPSRLA